MTHLPAAPVRDAAERDALSSGPIVPFRQASDHSLSGRRRFGGTRLALWAAVRERSARRHERVHYRALKRDLAMYTNRADVDDLLGAIPGQEDAEVEIIRNILAGSLHQQRTHQLASFRSHACGRE